ncbi:hypothetical protein [Microbulbifer echini]
MMDLEKNVIEAIEDGRTILAIKLLRESRAIDLKEAKGIVDSYMQERDIQPSPSEMPGRVGLIGVLLLLAITGYLAFGLGSN